MSTAEERAVEEKEHEVVGHRTRTRNERLYQFTMAS